MTDQTHDHTSGNVVTIFAIVILAGMALAFALYVVPMLQQRGAPSDAMKIEVEMPTPAAAPTEPAPQP